MIDTPKDGGPAFPQTFMLEGAEVHFFGISIRDYFAAKAMQAMLAAYPCQAIDDTDGGFQADYSCIAFDSYEMAEAMLEARK